MKLAVFLLLLVYVIPAAGQTTFLPAVKIRFVRTFALANTIKDADPDQYNQNKEFLPTSQLSYFELTGNEKATWYAPITEENNIDSRFADFYVENKVFTDLERDSVMSIRKLFSQEYFVSDTAFPVKWQFTGDRRMIAGFNCRKAIGLLCDTVVVFAFYAEDILVRGGPESIHGLPGMILGVGIPGIHTTWFATKVEILNAPFNPLPLKANEKKISRRAFTTIVDDMLKRMGNYRKMIFAAII